MDSWGQNDSGLAQDSSDEDNEDLQEKVYSILHYNADPAGIPEDIRKKFGIEITPRKELIVNQGPNISGESRIEEPKAQESKENENNSGSSASSGCVLPPTPSQAEDGYDSDTSTVVIKRSPPPTPGPEDMSYDVKREELDNIQTPVPSTSAPPSPPQPESSTSKRKRKRKKKRKKKSTDEPSPKKPRDSLQREREIVILDNSFGPSEPQKRPKPKTVVISDDSDPDLDSSDSDIIMTVKETETVELSSDDEGLGVEFKEPMVPWEHVDTPRSWTHDMKKFYVQPEGKYFDHKSYLRKVRGERDATWQILDEDRYPIPSRRPRCNFCREVGHIQYKCPRKSNGPVCTMCGQRGHLMHSCPKSICLSCGSRTSRFLTECKMCEKYAKYTCSICKRRGHREDLCTDVWRRFHRTVSGEARPPDQKAPQDNFWCPNCAQKGHLDYKCPHANPSSRRKKYGFRAIVTNYRDVPRRNQS